MNTLDFCTIALRWHCTPPADLAHVEQMVCDDLRRNVLPRAPAEVLGHFIELPPATVFVYGQEGSDEFHCVYFV